jgi:serine/threonine protein kinase
MIDGLGPPGVLTSPTNMGAVRTSGPYALRFHSPEQVKENETSKEGDVWSFGCLLYEVFFMLQPNR